MPLPTIRAAFPIALLLAAGCSAAGLELQNYGFYGANPTPDGGRLKPVDAVERVRRPVGGDTLDVTEGEFRIDTARVNGVRVWLVTRGSVDLDGSPVLDSVWMDRYSLKTIASVRRDSEGMTRLEFNRRQVRSLRITPEGRRLTWRGLHEGEPYGLAGIEVVIGAIPMRIGTGGSLPVVSGRGRLMDWLHYEIVEQTALPRMVAGGVVFEPVYLVQGKLGARTLHFWVDPELRRVVRRSTVSPDGARFLAVLGPAVPRIRVFPVEGLPGSGSPRLGGEQGPPRTEPLPNGP